MGKRQLVLYIDDDLISIAKNRGMNLSQMFNSMLQSAVNLPENEVSGTLESLKKQEAELTAKLTKVKALKVQAEEQEQKFGDLTFEVEQ